MSKSYSIHQTALISFRCAIKIKEELENAKQKFLLDKSEIIRIGIEIVMCILNNPNSTEKIMNIMQEVQHKIQLRKEAAARLSEAKDDASATVSLIERRDGAMRNITRLNKCYSGSDGFRVTIVRRKRKFERAFYDNEYGCIEAARLAAMTVRDYVLEQMLLRPDEFEQVKAEAHALLPPPYPSRKRRISSLLETGISSFHFQIK